MLNPHPASQRPAHLCVDPLQTTWNGHLLEGEEYYSVQQEFSVYILQRERIIESSLHERHLKFKIVSTRYTLACDSFNCSSTRGPQIQKLSLCLKSGTYTGLWLLQEQPLLTSYSRDDHALFNFSPTDPVISFPSAFLQELPSPCSLLHCRPSHPLQWRRSRRESSSSYCSQWIPTRK